MKVPLLDLDAHYNPIYQEVMDAIRKVFEHKKFIMGPEIEEFEKRVADYSGTKYAIGVSSGTDALLISLMALEIGPGDEVITTDYSFFATAGAIARTGARPVFVDIEPKSYNMDPSKIETAVTKKTKAIIVVHLYGQCADMEAVLETAKKHNLPVIEDAAQSIGSEYKNGKRAGAMGDIGCFSFFPSKNLGGIGDAGMVVTNRTDLAEKIKLMRVHGARQKYYHSVIGGNFRMDTIQAAALNVKLNYLDKWTAKRQKNALLYEKLFKEAGLLEKGLISLPDRIYDKYPIKHYHIYNQFVIRASQRDKLKDLLTRNEIGNDIYYPVPFHMQECFKNLGYNKGDFPESEKAAEETLALPIYPELTENQQKYVVEKIKGFYER